MKKGLIAWIYVNKSHGDCSNNGISARFDKVVVLNNPKHPEVTVPEIFEPTEDMPAVIIGKCGNRYNVSPVELADKWTMCGGTFVETSDGRWPFEGPISLHDRVEG